MKHLLKRNHIMLDIETAGTAPTAQILEIGAIVFRLDEGKIDSERILGKYDIFEATTATKDLHFDIHTLRFWLSNSNNVVTLSNLLTSPPVDRIDTSLARLTVFLDNVEDPILWAKPTHFDIPILMNTYLNSGAPLPEIFQYPNTKNIMDVTTIFNLLPKDKRNLPAKDKLTTVRHSAMVDCCVQIENLQAVLADVFL